MDRHYANGQNEKVSFFVGPEVENTIAKGMQTLFVVGSQPYEKIIERLNQAQTDFDVEIKHIFLTANQSLPEIEDWSVLEKLLNDNFLVTIDGRIDDVLNIKHHLPNHHNLIVILSTAIPELEDFNSNTTLKIDTNVFGKENPGVWCINLHGIIKDPSTFTPWQEYKQDIILKDD